MSKQEFAYHEIKKMILNGSLKPNSFLSERTLSEQLGVSRTPVRAALNDLCSENLIIFYQNKGMMVAGIRAEDIHDVYQIRNELDVLALKIIMDTSNIAVIEEMNRCLRAMADAENEENWREVVRQDMLFHDSYSQGVSNTRLRDILSSLHDQISRFLNSTMFDVDRIKASVREHALIMKAVNAGDVAGMKKAMRDHLQISREYHMRKVAAIGMQ